MNKVIPALSIAFLLCLAPDLFAQQGQSPQHLPPLSPPPTNPDPTVLDDQVPPMLTCKNAIRVVQEPGIARLPVTALLATASDNATPFERIELGIKRQGSTPWFPLNFLGGPIASEMFTCDELGTHTVELWARDMAGNTSYCEATVDIIDPSGYCPSGPLGAFVEVHLTTALGDGIEWEHVEIFGQHPSLPFVVTHWGAGLFELTSGSDITISPSNDDNPLNGVTTFDRVLISRHYNGIQRLNSPYKIIAADVNRDGVVDVKDSLDLTDVILGIHDNFPNNTSWRFVPKDYKFVNPLDPLSEPFPEFASISNIVGYERVDFIGIKVGDVNNTAIANFNAPDDRALDRAPLSIGLPYPNPTGAGALIPVHLQQPEKLRLELYDLSGRLVWFNDCSLGIGEQTLEIPPAALSASGMYVWRLRAGDVVKAGKLVRN